MVEHAIPGYRLSDHASEEMARRGIAVDEVAGVLAEPEQSAVVREGRVVFQSRVGTPGGRGDHLLRVFVDVDRAVPVVVTAYRTSKITKYWKEHAS
jgi:hypothetical protein